MRNKVLLLGGALLIGLLLFQASAFAACTGEKKFELVLAGLSTADIDKRCGGSGTGIQAGGGRPSIAVLGFNLIGIAENEEQLVSNKLRSELVNSQIFNVMTRDQINALLEEQALGQTLVEASEAAKAGKIKGVKYVVTGSLIRSRRAIQATFEMIDAETGRIINSITPRMYKGDFLDFLDIEVARIAAQLLPGSRAPAAGTARVLGRRSRPARLALLEGGQKIIILPGNFEGHGARRFEKESKWVDEKIKSILDKELGPATFVDPGKHLKMKPARVKKRVWKSGTGLGIGLGRSRPNDNFIFKTARNIGARFAVAYQTKAAFSIFSAGGEGDFTLYLYDVKTFKKRAVFGKYQKLSWVKDLGQGVYTMLARYKNSLR